MTRLTREAPAGAPLEVPRDLRWLTPRYEFVRELGRGMAVVYLAREREGVSDEPGREVAVKVIAAPHAADRETVERFAREARTATALRHPNIVRTLAIETARGDGRGEGDAVAIVTEYVSGETLRAFLQAQGALPFERAAAILRDVAAALAHAHAARIVHRDVKPENIFIETGTGRALLGDFGIARPIDADALLTQDGASLGTPAYMAPEQVDGLAVDERTDVYALGLVGWEMLSGRRPWQGETLYSLLQKQKHDALPDIARLRPDVPLYLHRAIDRALAKDPSARWGDAGEMLAQLSPSPERLPAADPIVDGAGTDRVHLEVASGATVRFKTGEIQAQRPGVVPPATPAPTHELPAPALAVPADEYLRDEAAVARLAPRPPLTGAFTPPAGGGRGRRWVVAAALATALAAAAATVARRTDPSSSGDEQLDSLLAQTTAPARSAAPAPRRDSAADSLRVRARPVPPRGPAPSAGARTGAAAQPTAAAGAPARHDSARGEANGEVVDASAAPPDSGVAGGANTAAPTVAATPAAAPRTAVRDACRSTTNADQRRCLMGLIYRNDAALNGRYQVLIGALRRQAGGASEPPAVRALRVEQRAWVDARDAACARQVPASRNPRWGVARAPCFEGFSTRRAAVLAARLRGKLPQAR